MAIWRSVELEALIGGPLDEVGLTEQSLQRLCNNSVPEGEQLDFKNFRGKVYPAVDKGTRQTWSIEQEFAKDAAAFATHRGGMILIGVVETGGIATQLEPITEEDSESAERRLRQAVLNYTAPPVELTFIPVPASTGGYYLTVIVPQSNRGPHSVCGPSGDAKRPTYWPVRHGADINWMTETEVAQRYQRRFSAQAAHTGHVFDITGKTYKTLRLRSNTHWLYMVVVPESRRDILLDRSAAAAAEDWLVRDPPSCPTQSQIQIGGGGIPASGCLVFTGYPLRDDDDPTDPHRTYLELHTDGCAVAATTVAEHTSKEVAGATVRTLTSEAILLTDVSTRWAARQTGSWGTATIATGLVYGQPRAFELIGSVSGEVQRVHRTRRLRSEPRGTTAADLAAVDTMQQRLVVAHYAVNGLLQEFGIVEADLITRDGALDSARWGYDWCRGVERWATAHGVECRSVPMVR